MSVGLTVPEQHLDDVEDRAQREYILPSPLHLPRRSLLPSFIYASVCTSIIFTPSHGIHDGGERMNSSIRTPSMAMQSFTDAHSNPRRRRALW